MNFPWIRRAALRARLFSGTWLNLGSSDAAAIAAFAGYDWALIDLEHGSGDITDLLGQLNAMQGFKTGSIVRVPSIDAVLFKQVLDMGPSGLMVPNVATVEQAERAVQLVRVPPYGIRGAATSTRNVGYGFGYDQYIKEANDNLLTVVQIESVEGLANVEAIAAVDGVDVLFVGPTDLSIDMGISSDPEGPEFAAALRKVMAAAEKHGKVAGALVRDTEQARHYFALGYSFIALGSDRGMVVKGMKQNAAFFAELGGQA